MRDCNDDDLVKHMTSALLNQVVVIFVISSCFIMKLVYRRGFLEFWPLTSLLVLPLIFEPDKLEICG